ncbi:hypothetical protein [Tenacibaculum sp. Bg11-29]|uniref:hypothetical protein n=1 Tax=Tenacibaculum sp. Bg11-29 TaxID=2058306 RepID=UPI001E3E283C|nr:hypothetical protein [Tenacibaculum sp. Bg11-29]
MKILVIDLISKILSELLVTFKVFLSFITPIYSVDSLSIIAIATRLFKGKLERFSSIIFTYSWLAISFFNVLDIGIGSSVQLMKKIAIKRR